MVPQKVRPRPMKAKMFEVLVIAAIRAAKPNIRIMMPGA